MGGGLFTLVLFVFVTVFASVSLASAGFVINEILYDPAGSDEGLEFVELYNGTGSPFSLNGLVLETGNGAGEDDWSVAFEWDSDCFVEPDGFVLVGEAAVDPLPQFVARLDLQNGPDACRLRMGLEVLDLVGWGEHTFPEYYEGAPADDVSSGLSIGRLPDGIDEGNNSLDFFPLDVPSPGRRNLCVLDPGLVPGSLRTDPLLPFAFENTEVSVEVENLGAEVPGAGECLVEFYSFDGTDRVFLGSRDFPPVLPGQSERVSISWQPQREQCTTLEALLRAEGDENVSNNVLSSCARVGVGEVVVTEIMYAPAPGGPEWVELFNSSALPVDLGGWSIEDSAERRAYVSPYPFVVGPGEYVVVTQDKALFQEQNAACHGRLVQPGGAWPSLNNHPSGGQEYADRVCIRDSTGCPTDAVAYQEDWSTRESSSLERVSPWVSSREAANWSSSVALSGSTPCGPNSVAEATRSDIGSGIGMSSRVISPDGDGINDTVVFSFTLPEHGLKVDFTIFDSNGRVVKRLLDRRKVGTVVQAVWDGTNLEGRIVRPAIYVVHLSVAGCNGAKRHLSGTIIVAPWAKG